MSGIDKENLKSIILNSIDSTRIEIEQLKELTKPISPENAIGRISRMDAINNKSVNEAALRTAEGKFSKLQQALEKIDEPTFGICIRCKQPIPEARLLLMPESTKCVNCA